MNIVQSGTMFMIYDDSVKTYSELPVGAYEVCCSKMTGFFLKTRNDFKVTEKVYGNHSVKVDKVLKSFQLADRNFGLILSGQKGIGKSMFMRVLAERASALGYPVIVVNNYIPGIDNFLGSIEQEVIVLFDEFEKTFRQDDDHHEPQEEMLSLFDGTDGGKKLFIITCNEVRKLNTYLLNRPGRFHYHFEILPPSGDEVREYMIDKLDPAYWEQVDKVVALSNSIYMTYDYLRAIAFELNQGYPLDEALADLNISRVTTQFDITVAMHGSLEYRAFGVSMDLYSDEIISLRAYDYAAKGNMPRSIWFQIIPTKVENINGVLTYPVSEINTELLIDEDDYWNEDKNVREETIARVRKALDIKSITLTKVDKGYIQRYAV
jgi:hypothetical protein